MKHANLVMNFVECSISFDEETKDISVIAKDTSQEGFYHELYSSDGNHEDMINALVFVKGAIKFFDKEINNKEFKEIFRNNVLSFGVMMGETDKDVCISSHRFPGICTRLSEFRYQNQSWALRQKELEVGTKLVQQMFSCLMKMEE